MNIRLTRWIAGGATAILFFATARTARGGDIAGDSPAISNPPASQTAAVGGAWTLEVTATGTAPLAYQWFKNGGMIVGATNSSLAKSAGAMTDTGVYYVAITNAAGLCLSTPVTVTVGAPQLWAWGQNTYGQLGDGSTNNRCSPVTVASNVVTAAAGYGHSLYVKSDGTLWAMGNNGLGCLGDGTGISRSNAVFVASNVVSVACGQQHSLYVKADGTLWAMGYNGSGQLGDGTTTGRSSPEFVVSNVIAVCAGTSHSLFMKGDGTAWAMGNNAYGQLGDGTTMDRHSPVLVTSNAVAVASGTGHCMFLKSDGTVWATGANAGGQFGDGTTVSRSNAVCVTSGATAVAAGGGALFVLEKQWNSMGNGIERLWPTGRWNHDESVHPCVCGQ